MTQWPKITVITPSYNQAQFLEGTITSVLAQDYPNLEYMVVDGGSTDGSVDVIRRYESHLAYWVSESDGGQVQAISKGLQRASGALFTWLNSDDLMAPGALRCVGEQYQPDRRELLYGKCEFVDAEGHYLSSWPYVEDLTLERIIADNLIPQPSCFVPLTALQAVGPLNEALHYAFDYEYWIRASLAGYRFRAIPMLFSRYRLHDSSKTQSMRARFDAEMVGIHRRLLSDARVAQQGLGPSVRTAVARCYRRFALEHYYWFHDRRQCAVFFRKMLHTQAAACNRAVLLAFVHSRMAWPGRRAV